MKAKERSLKDLLIHIGIILIISIAILLLFFYMFLPRTTNHGETVTVPKLVGMELNRLPDYAGEYLRYEVSDSGYSEHYPPLTVLEQYPRPGQKVKESRKIFLTVNRVLPPTVPVPDLVDHSLVNADAVLRSNELKRGRIIPKASPYLNLVLEMRHEGEEIKSGTRLPKGSTIDLVIGDGYGKNQKFPAPDLQNLALEEAKIVLRGSGLNLGVIIVQEDTTGQLPFVIRQKPDPYEDVQMGEEFILWIGPTVDSLQQAQEYLNNPDDN